MAGMFGSSSNDNSLRNLKSYVLIFRNKKDFFGKINNDVVLKSYSMDDRGQQRKNKELLRSKEKGENFLELNLTRDQEKRIKKASKITEEDINVFLDVVYDTLASGQGYDVVKETIQGTKDEIEYNPIFLVLLDMHNVKTILDNIEFPMKTEILEILNSSDNENLKYKKIEKILYFQEIQEGIKRVFINQGMQIAGYITALTLILFGIKLKLFPVIEEKLVSGFNLDREIILGDSLQMLGLFENIIYAILATVGFFLILFFVSKERFFQILFKIPLIGEIFQYGNTLKLLMTYSFNYTYSTKFRQSVFAITNQFFALKENTNLHKIGEIISYNYQQIKKRLGIKFYDPLVSVSLGTIGEGGSDVVEAVVSKKIDNYIKKMKLKQDKFEGLLQKITMILVAGMVFVMIGSIIVISFNAMKAVSG